ncbi:hypothetical protein DFH06DRAFT_1152314 [Mycena polygramma]|nr:hypothetical protein DFH06DRAFT_1152314 [Mycena polygramma]
MASSTAPPSPPSDADSSDGESIGDLDVYLVRVDAFKLHFYEDDDHSLRQVATVWFNLDGVLTDQWTELEYFADSHPARWYTAYPTFWQAKDSTRGILVGKYSDPIDELTYLVGDCITANPAEAEQLSRLPGARQIFRVFPDESAAQGPRSTSTQLAIRRTLKSQDVASQPHVVM